MIASVWPAGSPEVFNLARRGAAGRLISIAGSEPVQALLNPFSEFVGFRAELVVGKLLHLRFEGVDRLDVGPQRLDNALVLGPENLA